MLSQKNLGAIPHELRGLKQWVCWRQVSNPDDPERPKKLPVDPHPQNGVLRAGKSNDPETWGYLPTAVATAIKYHLAGIGFVFTPDDPFVGIDLDYCLNPETKELRPWAKQVLDVLESYTEISPSGCGVKVIARGKKPGAACKLAPIPGEHPRSELALYDAGRYFVVTGEVFNGSAEIRDAQTAVDMVYERITRNGASDDDDTPESTAEADTPPSNVDPKIRERIGKIPDPELLKKIVRSTDGEKFLCLWGGNIAGFPSRSEADEALCVILARWTAKDAIRIERLFSQSALGAREKWRERGDYRRRTIVAACKFVGEKIWTPGGEPALDWQTIFDSFEDFENTPPLSFAIDRFLQNDAATVVGGLAGHDKTWFLTSLAKAMLKGKGATLWDQFQVLETASRVVYIIPESTRGPFKHRLVLMGAYDFVRDGRLVVRTLSKGPAPSLADPRILAAAQGAIVMLDTLARFAVGDENSAAEFQALASDIFGLLAAGARAVVAAHHSPKSFAKENSMSLETMLRGTGDIGAIFATAWGVKQLDRDRNILHVENLKARDFQPPEPFQLIARPFIDQERDFRMHKWPGQCGSLADEQPPDTMRGTPALARESRAANLELLRMWIKEDPTQTSDQLTARFEEKGIKLHPGTVRKYRAQVAGE